MCVWGGGERGRTSIVEDQNSNSYSPKGMSKLFQFNSIAARVSGRERGGKKDREIERVSKSE